MPHRPQYEGPFSSCTNYRVMVDIERLYQECMADGDARSVDASLIGRYVESPFAAYCDLFAPVEERDPLDPYQDLLFTRGQKHESDITPYQKYVDSGCKEGDLLDKILIVDEDDCRATMYVKDWLQVHV